ncbi:TetR/AcrR family transcriptional regulator [Fervidibacillus halotolerans]|uniref:TetR/AcrR family transcriptional regulator n=1 Tax=Fervidibacillus halotolerans TaxID=2980027 RepID=A0A9E8LYP1_9BACI|nr:TetR/AcrR family transcriptional regulator [Fervidibacillus halotolerans]WAA12203.1 TetR/AcrR family transcriptional regulator [Fervidibacillus halotolerans]
MSEKQTVPSSVKDTRLIQIRREQMIKGAISLFKEKGFHRTTTREIAKASGFSIGTLYEYIRTKEDILYLVCDQIYDEVQEKIKRALHFRHVTKETIKEGIAAYFKIMDELQDEVLVMYQEIKSLPREMLPVVLKKELEMVAVFEDLLRRYFDQKGSVVSDEQIRLYAHNIIVQGQMWGFRRWALRKHYTLEKYTEWQFHLLINGIDQISK